MVRYREGHVSLPFPTSSPSHRFEFCISSSLTLLNLSRMLTLPVLPPAWTAEIQADVSVALTNFRHPKTGEKTRQLGIVVAHGYGKRLHEGSANRLFHRLKDAVENAGVGGIKEWKRPDGRKLLPRRAVYEYQSDTASRKFWRPIIEEAVRTWEG